MTQQSPWRAFPLTAAIALAGGLIFAALHAPLPWVLGPMSACAAAAAGGAKVALSANLRTPMVGLLGAYLGSRFDWATVAMMAANPWTAAGLLGYSAAALAAGMLILVRLFAWPKDQAFFAAMPGGLNDMVMLAEDAGLDSKRVAAVQGLRIFLVVMSLPPLILFLTHTGGAGHSAFPPLTVDWPGFAAAVVIALIGPPIGRFMRIPAPWLVGPMILAAIAALSGALTVAAPPLVLAAAQVVLGGYIGCRFVGMTPRDLLRATRESALMVLAMGAILAPFLALFAGAVDPVALALAYAPGGVNEMGLVAAALHIEAAFVISHHVLRIAFVIAFYPLLARLFGVTLGPRRAR